MCGSTLMLSRTFALLLLLRIRTFSLITSSIIPPPPPFNLSHFIFPKVTVFTELDIPVQPPHFLQGVLEAIATKEKWELEDIKVSQLDVKKVKYRTGQRHEFKIRVGKSEIAINVYEGMSQWKKLAIKKKNMSANFESLVKETSLKVVINSFKIEGPFELRVAGDNDSLSLSLPFNATHTGLRRISVGEGITVDVQGAEEISTFLPSDHYQPWKWNEFGSIWPELCMELPSIHILGSASVVAFRSTKPSSLIQTVSQSRDAIQLLPDKCYVRPNYQKPRHSFSLQRVLMSLKINIDVSSRSQKAIISASTLFRFQLELEKDVRSNDTYWSTLAGWRTRPIVERLWFEVTATIEGDIFKPLVIKKVRPLNDVGTLAWSSLLSNHSFTKLSSGLVHPEALTLDVKW